MAHQSSVTCEDARLAVWQHGQGETVLLLHGYMGSHLTWRHLVEPLSQSYRVVTVDWAGWGESEKNPSLDYTYETELSRLGTLIRSLDATPLHLVGHDYGGFLALGYTQRHPGDVRDLVLVNTRAHRTFRRSWYVTFGGMHLLGRVPGAQTLYRMLPLAPVHRWFLRHEQKHGIVVPEVVQNYAGPLATPEGKQYLARYMRHYRVQPRVDLQSGLEDMQTPTLILWGAQDRYLDVSIARDLDRKLPHSRLRIFPRAGHFLPEEEPAQVFNEIVDFYGASKVWLGSDPNHT